MSTANKLTYLNVTKQKLKQAINNIGGDITDETTFRQYANQLQNVYDNLPKTEYQEGTEVTIENGLKGKIDFDDGKVGFGQASQESTQGYNLLPLNPTTLRSSNPQGTWTNDYTFTKDGITYKIDYDTWKIKVSGTATAVAILAIPIAVTQGNTYRISGCPSGGGTSNYMVYMMDTTTFTQSVNDTGSGVVLQSASYTNYEYRIRIANGYTANNLVYEPMVIDGSTAKTFEKYTGGYASPSPNWEQEIKCVAGRNIWGGIGTFNNANLAKTNADGTIDINITNTAITSAVTSQAVSFGLTKVLKRGTYTFTAENLISNMFCQIIKVNSETSGEVFKIISTSTKSQTFTITEDMTYFVRVQAEEGTTFNGTIKPMVEEGTQATPYLPYNTIEEVVSGKNLIDEDTLKIGTIYNQTSKVWNGVPNWNSTPYILVKENTSYTLSFTSYSSYMQNYVTFLDKNYNYISGGAGTAMSSLYRVFETPTNCAYIVAGYRNDAGAINPMIETGNTATTYEPYVTPRTYQFSLGNNKFYNIGTYRDYILRTTGKNKFDEDVEQGAISSTVNETYAQNKVNNATRIRTKDLIALDKNKTYTISCNSNYKVVVQAFNDSQLLYTTTGTNAWVTSTTITNVPYIAIAIKKVDETNITPSEIENARVMIEIGSTASDYQPFGVGNWYKFEKIGFYKITGQETIWEDSQQDRFAFNNLVDILHLQARQQIYCNRFQYVSSGSADYGMFAYWNGAITQVFIYDKDYTDPDDLKNYFANNETYFCYIRNTPVLTPITGELANQLEEWWNAQSLDGTTIIEGNGDLPMIIKVRGLKGE